MLPCPDRHAVLFWRRAEAARRVGAVRGLPRTVKETGPVTSGNPACRQPQLSYIARDTALITVPITYRVIANRGCIAGYITESFKKRLPNTGVTAKLS